jgi:hypothetical protein
MNVRSTLITLVVVIACYMIHSALKAQYHTQCSRDLFRVFFYSKSSMCSYVDQIVTLLEIATFQTGTYIIAQLLSGLGEFLNWNLPTMMNRRPVDRRECRPAKRTYDDDEYGDQEGQEEYEEKHKERKKERQQRLTIQEK